MSANQLVLLAAAYGRDPAARRAVASDLGTGVLRKIWFGLLTAVVLYGIFWLGNWLVRELWAGAAGGIASVYGFKRGAAPVRVALLIGLLIGPGEELVWRGAIQRVFTERLGRLPGLLLATALYTAVHLSSGNPMLILAALVCGLYWGYLYQRTGSILLVVVSHTVWDLMVFLLLPFS
jgi:membrane protease YdiL (CAAX protease family)